MYTTFQMYQKIVSICFNRRMSPRGTPSNHEWRTVQDVTCAQPDLDEPAIARCHHVGTWVMQKTWFPKKKWDVSLNRGRVKLTNLLLLKARDGLEGHQCLRRFQTLMQLWMFYATFCHIWQVWWTLKIPKTAQRSGCGSLRFQKNIILTSPAKPQKTLEFSLDLRPWGGDSIMNRFFEMDSSPISSRKIREWPDRISHTKEQHPRTDKGPPQANNLHLPIRRWKLQNKFQFSLDLKAGTLTFQVKVYGIRIS